MKFAIPAHVTLPYYSLSGNVGMKNKKIMTTAAISLKIYTTTHCIQGLKKIRTQFKIQ